MKNAAKIIFIVLTTAMGIFSLCCFLYPSVSNYINEQFNNSTINKYNNNVKSVSQEQINSLLRKAEQYNQAIATEYFDGNNTDYEEILNDYNNILNINNGLIGYIEIPSISVKLPIYHGESEKVLKKGAAHMEQTSFPIGGQNTHACISAHSGYPTQKFFDDIDELVPNEIINIKILNTTYIYKVYNKEVIEPDDVKKLSVVQGQEILTLVTCYPYGINSHRLLVHASFEGTEAPAHAMPNESQIRSGSKTNFTVPITCAIIVSTAVFSVAGVILYLKRKRADNSKFKR